jgi:hypothetical protein
MKNISYLSCILLLACSTVVSGQKGKLSLGYDTLHNNQSEQILVIYSNDKCTKGLLVENDTTDFTLKGRIFDEMQNEYIIFSSYSEPVGCTLYYLFDIERKAMYASEAVREWEIPILFSFDRNTLSMNLLSYDALECGKISKLPFTIEKMQDYDVDLIKGLRFYRTIDL